MWYGSSIAAGGGGMCSSGRMGKRIEGRRGLAWLGLVSPDMDAR